MTKLKLMLAAAVAGSVGLTPLAAPLAQTSRAAASSLSAEDQALVARASAYLQGLSSAKGDFIQTDSRGRTTRGTFYLQRPGKARFEYAAPSGLLIVSDGSNVNVHDKRLKTFDRYPLGSTPLALFLARQVRLDQGVKVERVTRTDNGFQILARDARRQADGAIAMTFGGSPLRLTEWTVIDPQGGRTRVQLSSLQPASGLSPSLFVLRDPNRRGNSRS